MASNNAGENGEHHRKNGTAKVWQFPELYRTARGRAVVTKSEDFLPSLPSDSVDLVFTSPPFALLRQKAYGNKDQAEYVDWLVSFGPEIKRVLKETGSFVIDLGGAYQRGAPARSLYNFRVLLRLCDEHGFYLAEDFYWHNPARLPSPIEWVNKRKMRAKDSVDTVWWLSKSEFPKANVSNVLVPYSDRMKKLIKDPSGFFRDEKDKRPSGHEVTTRFTKDNGGAIPPNLLQYPNTDSNSLYIRHCKANNIKPHPARFPSALPEFFIKFLTDPDDMVLDTFAGSNTTGEAAESLGRKWLALDSDREYIMASAFRFMVDWSDDDVSAFVKSARKPEASGFEIEPRQGILF
jgi:DNA modification methylase